MEIIGLLEKIINVDKLDKLASLALASIISFVFYFKISNSLVSVIFVFIFIWASFNFIIKVSIARYKLYETYKSFCNDELIIIMAFTETGMFKLHIDYFYPIHVLEEEEEEVVVEEEVVLYDRSMLENLLVKNVFTIEDECYVINTKIYKYVQKKIKKNKIVIKKISENKNTSTIEEIRLTETEKKFIWKHFMENDSVVLSKNYEGYNYTNNKETVMSLSCKEYISERSSHDSNWGFYVLNQLVYDYAEDCYMNSSWDMIREEEEVAVAVEKAEVEEDELPF